MEKGKNLLSECDIMGYNVKLEDIENPHIVRAIEKRNGFLFNHSEYTETKYQETPNAKTSRLIKEKYAEQRREYLKIKKAKEGCSSGPGSSFPESGSGDYGHYDFGGSGF